MQRELVASVSHMLEDSMPLPLFDWSPSATVIPFPLTKRRGFAHRHAKMMLSMRRSAAEAHLQRQLAIQRETLARRGVAPDRIEAEVSAFERQIRVEAAKMMARSNGAA